MASQVPSPRASGTTIPDPALVVLVGPSGSGKSTWAAARYRAVEIVSSDRLRAIVGSGEHDLDASADAFAVLDQIVSARLQRGLTTVVDTLGLDPERRRGHLELARRAGLPAVAVLFDTDPAQCRSRNRDRAAPVPAGVLDAQLRRMRDAADQVAAEGWRVVRQSDSPAVEPSHSVGSQRATPQRATATREPAGDHAATEPVTAPARLGFVLQVSRF